MDKNEPKFFIYREEKVNKYLLYLSQKSIFNRLLIIRILTLFLGFFKAKNHSKKMS
jgi:hypothetical protein